MSDFRRFFAAAAVCGMLGQWPAGCGHMPVTSMVKLARLDLQTTDPEQLRVALKLPSMLKARTEGTVLRIAVRLANGAEDARDFSLREATSAERAALAAEAEGGSAVFAYALAHSDVAQLRMFRAELMRRQKGGSGGAITIAVRPDTCRTAPLPNGPLLFSTYLKTAETNGYVPLARDLDLRRLDPDRDHAAMIPACG
jgi:hypothetical protein